MNTEKIANFLFEIATLRRLTRSHRQVIADVSDNISDHSFRVAIIGMILANLDNGDENKVVKMCLFHDIAEARTGDANWVNQQYLDIKESEARQDQIKDLPISQEVTELLEEYKARQTKESLIAKDADLLDQMILQQEYFYRDKENGERWQNHTEKQLKTQIAKTLAQQIRTTNPLQWVYQLSDEKTDHQKS